MCKQVRKPYNILLLILLIGHSLFASKNPDTKKLEQYLNNKISELQIPGLAIGVIYNNEIYYTKGFGYKDLENKDIIDENTIFAISSITKTFTASLFGILVSDNLIKFYDKVKIYDTSFFLYNNYYSDNLKVSDLLSHSTGLKTNSADFLWYGSTFTSDEILKKLRYIKPVYKIGQNFGYSSLMYLEAGYILEIVEKKPWDSILFNRILRPLNMNNTFVSNKYLNKNKNIAKPYILNDNGLQQIDFFNCDNILPAASMYSCINDLLKWIKCNLNQKIIAKNVFDEMLQIKTKIDIENYEHALWPLMTKKGYGIGWNIIEYKNLKIIYHEGASDGMSALVAIVPELNSGFTILMNRNIWFTHLLLFSVADWLLENKIYDYSPYFIEQNIISKNSIKKYIEKIESQKINIEADRLKMINGKYFSEIYGEAQIYDENGKKWIYFEKLPLFKAQIESITENKYLIEMIKIPWLPKGTIDFIESDKKIKMYIYIPNIDFDFSELDFYKALK
jgi:CubicO group peptidase (beta-lactamase class C family)